MPVWSVGYEGHTPESFLALLQRAGVNALADVRERPQSRKKGFGKRSLEAFLLEHGIGYVHLKDLGAPADVRHEYHATHDTDAFRAAYRHHLDGQRVALDQLESLAQRRRTAMMCLERDASECHRRVLA
ncbi:MAG: DUF488 domain-containing protein, partial [Halobacteriales archaeon]|nr:DUF488 domain-containing protein [Halobacteriales archaeon]